MKKTHFKNVDELSLGENLKIHTRPYFNHMIGVKIDTKTPWHCLNQKYTLKVTLN